MRFDVQKPQSERGAEGLILFSSPEEGLAGDVDNISQGLDGLEERPAVRALHEGGQVDLVNCKREPGTSLPEGGDEFGVRRPFVEELADEEADFGILSISQQRKDLLRLRGESSLSPLTPGMVQGYQLQMVELGVLLTQRCYQVLVTHVLVMYSRSAGRTGQQIGDSGAPRDICARLTHPLLQRNLPFTADAHRAELREVLDRVEMQ